MFRWRRDLERDVFSFSEPYGCRLQRRLVCAVMLLVPCAGLPSVSCGQPEIKNDIVVDLFVRPDSAQCQRAREFLAGWQHSRPGIELRVHDVSVNRDELVRLWKLVKRFGHEKAGLPTVYLADRLIVGFRDADTTGREIEDSLRIHAYVRPGCRHCREAKEFLDGLLDRWPALGVQYHDIVNDAEAQAELRRLAKRYQVRALSFPCIQVAGRLLVGFQGADTTGRKIEQFFERREVMANQVTATADALDDFQSQPQATALPPATATLTGLTAANLVASLQAQLASQEHPLSLDRQDDAFPQESSVPVDVPMSADVPSPSDMPLPDEVALPDDATWQPTQDLPATEHSAESDIIEVPVFGRLRVRDMGMPAFTFLIGLVDGFNPCAMWVLVFLLSVLVNIKERKKIIVIAGTFVVVSGLAYFAFMAAWFNVFQLIGLLRPVQIGLGVLAIVVGAVNIKDFFAFHKGVSFSIPESAKPGIYRRVRKIVSAKHLMAALMGAVVLAVVVNIVELLCTAGLPALYTEVLALQDFPAWVDYSYLALYISAYMLDDAIMVTIVVLTLSHRRLQEIEGRWLKLLSGCVIALLGGVMLFQPQWLV